MVFREAIKATCISQALQGLFINGALIDALNEVENILERAILFSFFNNAFNGRVTNTF